MHSKNKFKVNKGVLLTTAVLIAVVVATPFAYTKWWLPYNDQRIYTQVKSDVGDFLENGYTGAIKEHVTAKDVSRVSKDISKIHDEELRVELEIETKGIIEQAQIQARAKDTLEELEKTTKFEEVNTESATRLLEDAGAIKNVTLRAKVLRAANNFLERYNSTKAVIDEVNGLKAGDWAAYYTAEANVKTVDYPEVKTELLNKLVKIKDKNQKSDKERDTQDAEKLKGQVQAAEKIEYDNSVVKGKSELIIETETTTSVLNTADEIAKSHFTNNSAKLLILVHNKEISVYEHNTSTSGYSKLKSESTSVTSLSTPETTNVGVGAVTDENGNTIDVVKASDLVISTAANADIRVSKSFMSTLVSALNKYSEGVTFLVK